MARLGRGQPVNVWMPVRQPPSLAFNSFDGHGDAAAGGGTSALSVTRALAGHGDAAAAGPSNLTLTVESLAGHGDAAANGPSSLSVTRSLAGHGDAAASTASAAVSVARGLSGHGDAAANGPAVFVFNPLGLSGHGDAAAAGPSNLILNPLSLAGHGDAAASGVGDFAIALGFSHSITFPPQRKPASALAAGGRYKPLSANLQGYSQQDVERVMRSGVAMFRPRFELYDRRLNLIEPSLGGVTAAKVTYDETRELKGSLELSLLPDERLRNAPFQYLIKAIFGVGPMPGGGFAEFPEGVYPWTKPKRNVHGTTGKAEDWTIVLADQLHRLQTAGVGPEPLLVAAGSPLVANILNVLDRAGFTNLERDLGAVTWSDLPVPLETWYTWQTTALFDTTITSQQPAHLLNIEKELHKGLGYAEPKFDLSGLYQAQPDRIWDLEPADVIYDTGDDGVVLLPTAIEPDLSVIANRVGGWTAATGASGNFGEAAANFSSIIDLNDVLPQHPLAQVNAKQWIDQTLQNPLASSDLQMTLLVLWDLWKRLAYYEKMTLKRVGFLAQHDPPGLVGVRIANDPDLGSDVSSFLTFDYQGQARPTTLFRETGHTLDLFTGNAESHLTGLSRRQ